MASEAPPFSDKIPTFTEPRSFLTPQISNLISDNNHLFEDGISFVGYRRCNADDSSEVLKSGGRSLNFLFQVINGTDQQSNKKKLKTLRRNNKI